MTIYTGPVFDMARTQFAVTAENAGRLRCRVLAEGANGPTTPDADAILDQRRDEVFVIPTSSATPAA